MFAYYRSTGIIFRRVKSISVLPSVVCVSTLCGIALRKVNGCQAQEDDASFLSVTFASALLGKIFSGMGMRPVYLTVVAARSLEAYLYAASLVGSFPDYLKAMQDWTGMSSRGFHRIVWRHLSTFVFLLVVPLVLVRALEG
jgi:hypothetical protein